MLEIVFNAPHPTSAHSVQLTSQSRLSEVIVKYVIWLTASIVTDQTTATIAPHHILLTLEHAFSAVSVAALFAKPQISVLNVNPEIQQTTEPFALAATSSNAPSVFQIISAKIVKTISLLVLLEHV